MPAVPLVVTGDMVSDRLRELAGLNARHLRKMLRVYDEGMDAVLPEKRVHKTLMGKFGPEDVTEITEGGAPDHDHRIKAAAKVQALSGLDSPGRPETVNGLVPILAVTIIHEPGPNGAPRTALPSHGVVIHHDGDGRNGA